MRLQEKTPVRLALKESISNTRRKFGRPKLTWLNTIKKELSLFNIELDLNLNEMQIERRLVELTRDRTKWKILIKNIMAVTC